MRCVTLLGILAATLVLSNGAQAAEALPVPKGIVVLTVSGRIEQTNAQGQARFDREMLEALGKSVIETGSVFSDQRQRFEGVPLRAVMERVGAKGGAIRATALNDYEIVVPWTDLEYAPILALQVDGKPLQLRDKGPLWIVYPRDAHQVLQDEIFDSRWVWQLKKLHVE
jgi:hypothetical protein